MTVNWERLSGEDVEQFVAAMILLANPTGNRITPSRGDRGVDIRVDTPDGTDIYQVKRFTRPLSSTQQRDIIDSWNRFVDQTLPITRVRSWTLACPWDPTTERRRWLLENVTAAHQGEFTIGWLGRIQLDVMSAHNPRLVDYFFGGGKDRAVELVALALADGAPAVDIDTGSDLLDAVVTRQSAQLTLLNEIDPFYRYEVEVRVGQVEEAMHSAPTLSGGATIAAFRQIARDHYSIIKVFALSAESDWLRPIRFNLVLRAEPGTPEWEALRRFQLYGAPLAAAPGVVTESMGPAGVTMEEGPGLFSISPLPGDRSHWPDLELRLLGPDGDVLQTIDLIDLDVTTGLSGTGQRFTATDPTGVLNMEALVNVPQHQSELHLQLRNAGGCSPRDVVPTARLISSLSDGRSLDIAIRGGLPVQAPWNVTSGMEMNAGFLLDLCEVLLDIQRHVMRRVVIPSDLTQEWFDAVKTASRLIRGEVVQQSWEHLTVPMNADTPAESPGESFQIIFEELLRVELDGEQVETDVHIRSHFSSVRIAERHPSGTTVLVVPGDSSTYSIQALPTVDPVPTGVLDPG